MFKPSERLSVLAHVDAELQHLVNQLFLVPDKPVALKHTLLREFERASDNLPIHNSEHNVERHA